MKLTRLLIAPALLGVGLGGGLAAQEGKPAKAATPAKAGTAAVKLTQPVKQDPGSAEQQAKYQKNYAEKLEKEFIAYGGWITDWDVARKKAKAEGKQIFAYFSRSYAP